MPNYHRARIPGGTYFFTLVTQSRRLLFSDATNIDRLRTAMISVRQELPFETLAACVLPDHLHLLWKLPPGDSDYSTRIGRCKALFTPDLPPPANASRRRRREREVWQPRFWEHVIRDKHDLKRHVEYIHYNPVKHRLARCPHDWPHSSFHRWVERGVYPIHWACSCGSLTEEPLSFDDIKQTVGE